MPRSSTTLVSSSFADRPTTRGSRAVSYFNEAASLEGVDSYFNLGYAYWLDGDASAAVWWLREAVRRNPADHAAHFVLGVALTALGSQTEAGREKDLARQLSPVYSEWEAKSPAGSVPQGLERLRMDLGLPDAASSRERDRCGRPARSAPARLVSSRRGAPGI